MLKLFKYSLVLIFIFKWVAVAGQPFGQSADSALINLINKTNKVLGADDELVNGKIYTEENLFAEGHPFLFTSEWLHGTIIINGEEHTDLYFKYNVFSDELILKAKRREGKEFLVSLNNGFIDEFRYLNKSFVNTRQLNTKDITTDFAEELYKGNIGFYISYTKTYNKNYVSKTTYGSYSETESTYFLMKNEALTRITSKKVLLNSFNSHKKDIRKFLKQNKIKFKKASHQQLYKLLKYCDKLVN